MLKRQQSFHSLPQAHCSRSADKAGCAVKYSEAGFLLLQSKSPSNLLEALTTELGLALPGQRESRVCGNYTLLWLTPTDWLLELPPDEIDLVLPALAKRIAPSLAFVTDMSNGYTCLEVTGPRANEILMSGCSLELRAEALHVGRVASTALADVPTIIWNPGGAAPRFRCCIDRAWARHLHEWLAAVGESLSDID